MSTADTGVLSPAGIRTAGPSPGAALGAVATIAAAVAKGSRAATTRQLPDAAGASAALEGASAEEILRWALSAFEPGKVALVSAFGPGSAVLIHYLHGLGARLPVIFIDTLHHFPETLEHVIRVGRRYDLDLRIFRPAESRAAFEAIHGPELWKRDLAAYQQATKVEPFRRATAGLDGWITGRRRDQAESRAAMPLVEGGAQLRVNPLAGWTRTDIWRFILEKKLPYNPLHDRGYTSIGDEPLTTTVAAGEHERAGRWRGAERLECGIHEIGGS